MNEAAYRLVRAQEENMVLKPWVLLATLLLQDDYQNQGMGPGEQGVELGQLTEQVIWLRGVAQEYGAFLYWPGRFSDLVFMLGMEFQLIKLMINLKLSNTLVSKEYKKKSKIFFKKKSLKECKKKS